MCLTICTRRRDHRGRALPEKELCPECQDDHEAYLMDQGTLAELAMRAKLVADIPPATDAEWLAYLDDVAPLVDDLAQIPASVACPLCGGCGAITVDTPLVASGSLRVGCPWCCSIGVVPDEPEWRYPDLSERRAG